MNLETYNPFKNIFEVMKGMDTGSVSPLCGGEQQLLKSFARPLVGLNLFEPPMNFLKTKFC
ncbi:hypothetical protein HYW44_02860 [Candidatus Daviesbacteria bacterium]|nr:hypothetical protein [Candidatus Daviesbacteria bacterium]